MPRLLVLLLLAAVALAGEAAHRFATLQGCLPGGPAHDLILEWLEEPDGAPRPECFALAPTWNGAEHRGTIAHRADGALEVELSVEPDPWVGGGVVRVRLDPAAGRWSGEAFGEARAGTAALRSYPLRPAPVPGFAAPAAGERPRLLFRAAQLPALRAYAATPAGSELLRRLEESCKLPVVGGDYDIGFRAAGMAFIGLLTGRQDAFARSREMAIRCVNSNTAQGETGGYAHFLAGLALAYDLAGDAWPADLRATVRAYLAGWTDLFTTMHVPINQGAVPLLRSGHFQQSASLARFRAATLLAALALDGESTPFSRPEPRRVPVPVEVPAGASPDAAVPRHPAPGSPAGWLLSGPLAAEPEAPGALRPAPGAEWRPLAAVAARANPFAPPGPPVLALPGPGRWLLHTAIRVEAPATLRWRSGGEEARCWIAGTPVDEGGLATLPAGEHALTVLAVVRPGRPGALALRLEVADAAGIAAARREADGWRLRHARWLRERAAYEASGGTWPMRDAAATCLRGLARYYVEAHGETGWPGANNTADGCFGFIALATAAARIGAGLDLAPGEDEAPWRYADSAWVRLPNGNGDELTLNGVEPFEAYHAMPEGPRSERFRGMVRARVDGLGRRLGTFDYGDIRPLMLALVHHADLAGPVRPAHDGLPRQQIDRAQASAVFRDRIDDQLAAVRVLAIGAQRPAGLGRREQAHAGAIAMRRGRVNWLPYHRGHDDVYYGREVLSVPSAAGLQPSAGAALLAASLADDGGGTVSWDLGASYGGAVDARRDLAVAFPGEAVAMVLALRDRLGTGRAWSWRLAQGSPPSIDADGLGAVQEADGWRCTLRLSAPAGARLAWRQPDGGRPGFSLLELQLDGAAEVRAVVVLHRIGSDPAISLEDGAVAGGGRSWRAGPEGLAPR